MKTFNTITEINNYFKENNIDATAENKGVCSLIVVVRIHSGVLWGTSLKEFKSMFPEDITIEIIYDTKNKYRFEVVQKNDMVTSHQSFDITSENSRMALMWGLQHMIQDKMVTSIRTSIKPVTEAIIDRTQEKRIMYKKCDLGLEMSGGES